MFFNIDFDSGEAIVGWIAPDNPSASARLTIVVPGRDDIEIDAVVPRFDIRDAGMHGTGLVGFVIDSRLIPDIAGVEELEIIDTATRTPLYGRHSRDRHIERKVFVFDAALLPQRRILSHVRRRFALNYANCERYSLETMIVLINNHFSKSIFMTGRSNFNRYDHYFSERQFLRAALLRDPFEELAERLMFLNLLAKSNAQQLMMELATGVGPLIEFASNLEFNDPKALLAAFRGITDEQRIALESPMVRMLGCNIDERPERRHVSAALENLATIDVVGVRSRYDAFAAMLNSLLGAEALGADRPAEFQTAATFAATLSRIGIVVDLVEHDLALYGFAGDAVRVGLERSDRAGDARIT